MHLHPESVDLDMGMPVFEVVVACVTLGHNATELVVIDCSKFGCTELILDALSCPVLEVAYVPTLWPNLVPNSGLNPV